MEMDTEYRIRTDMLQLHYQSLYRELCAAAQTIGHIRHQYNQLHAPAEFATSLQTELDTMIDRLEEHRRQ
jgi:hypothetical protein